VLIGDEEVEDLTVEPLYIVLGPEVDANRVNDSRPARRAAASDGGDADE
jgi:hypothetical protein